ncbi:MAG: hypothetical protein LBQ21_04820 [Clostridiales Family XIII bacterium]|jgi:hypothetical protein|nr:hypothetical protein [Clostridiales Family XIII bacterium]
MLFRYELRKVALLPAIIGFAALCLIVNVLIIAAYERPLSDDAQTRELTDVFEGLRASSIADSYVSKHDLSGAREANVRAKYEKLQPVIDAKAARDDALSVYLGPDSYSVHGQLFGRVLPAVIAEGCLIALFLALLCSGYEHIHNTEAIVYTSKPGRNIIRTKFLAALTGGLGLFCLILVVTLSIFFARFDFSPAWNENVSSGFNFAVGLFGKPFITWESCTVLQYLWASVGAAAGLVVCFCLLGYAVGTFIRNVYLSCLAAILLCGAMLIARPLLQIGGIPRGIINLTPLWLWANSGEWFTDGGADILWARFEGIGIATSLILLAAATVVAAARFKRRNLD